MSSLETHASQPTALLHPAVGAQTPPRIAQARQAQLQAGRDFEFVTSFEAVGDMVAALATELDIGLDTETAYPRDPVKRAAFRNIYNLDDDGNTACFDPHTAEIRLMQLKGRHTKPYVVDMWALDETGVDALKLFFSSYTGTYIIHNAKFDLKMVRGNLGLWLHESGARIFCTQQASKLIANSVGVNERGHRLVDIARDFLEVDLDKTEQISDWSRPALTAEQLEYAALDTIHLHALKDILKNNLLTLGQDEPLKYEMGVVPVTAHMEFNGLPIDPVIYRKIQVAARYEMPALLGKIGQYFREEIGQTLAPTYVEIELDDGTVDHKLYMLPWAAGKVGKDFLMSKTNLVPAMLKDLGLETDDGKEIENVQKATLEAFRKSHPGVGYLIDYWNLVKQAQFKYEDYIHPLTGNIHARFNISGASTGRFSSSNPNLQQVPGKFFMKHPDGSMMNYRQCFKTDDGWVMCSADFSGQELAVMAVLSGDPVMIKTLNTPGADLHSEAAAGMFNIPVSQARDVKPGDPSGKTYRDYGKIVMFSLAYGKTAKGFAKDWKISEKEAKKIIDNFEKKFAVLAAWLKRQGSLAAIQNYSRLPNGAMRFVGSGKGVNGEKERQGANYQIQGMSSWMTRIAMIMLDDRIRAENLNMRLVACVHDELLVTFKHWDGCPYGVVCRDEDGDTNELKAQMKQAKKDGDKGAEKSLEKLIDARADQTRLECDSTCRGQHDCATRYERIVGECMKAAGETILKGVVPAGFSTATRIFWSH